MDGWAWPLPATSWRSQVPLEGEFFAKWNPPITVSGGLIMPVDSIDISYDTSIYNYNSTTVIGVIYQFCYLGTKLVSTWGRPKSWFIFGDPWDWGYRTIPHFVTCLLPWLSQLWEHPEWTDLTFAQITPRLQKSTRAWFAWLQEYILQDFHMSNR